MSRKIVTVMALALVLGLMLPGSGYAQRGGKPAPSSKSPDQLGESGPTRNKQAKNADNNRRNGKKKRVRKHRARHSTPLDDSGPSETELYWRGKNAEQLKAEKGAAIDMLFLLGPVLDWNPPILITYVPEPKPEHPDTGTEADPGIPSIIPDLDDLLDLTEGEEQPEDSDTSGADAPRPENDGSGAKGADADSGPQDSKCDGSGADQTLVIPPPRAPTIEIPPVLVPPSPTKILIQPGGGTSEPLYVVPQSLVLPVNAGSQVGLVETSGLQPSAGSLSIGGGQPLIPIKLPKCGLAGSKCTSPGAVVLAAGQ